MNLLVCVLNVTVFASFMITFFWFVLSRLMDAVVADKLEIVIRLAERNPVFRAELLAYVDARYERVARVAAVNAKAREEHNTALVHQAILPFIYAFISIGLLLILWVRVKHVRVTRVDGILVCLNLFSFSAELVFYYVLLLNWIVIGDVMLIRINS